MPLVLKTPVMQALERGSDDCMGYDHLWLQGCKSVGNVCVLKLCYLVLKAKNPKPTGNLILQDTENLCGHLRFCAKCLAGGAEKEQVKASTSEVLQVSSALTV